MMRPLCLLTLLAALVACTPTPSDVTVAHEPAPIYPDYRDVTIPENIAPLNFLVRAAGCDAIVLQTSDSVVAQSSNAELTFSLGDWRKLMTAYRGKTLTLTLTARINGEWLQYEPFTWTVSSDSIDPYLTYRLIEPDYEIWNHIVIEQRCLENFDVSPVAHHARLQNRCMNCHTYASGDPQLSMMYVRGNGGGAVLNRAGRLEKLSIPGAVYFGFSPSGRYIVYSTNQIIPGFHTKADKRLEVFDSESNVCVYDLHERRVLTSPLLSDSLVFETFPTFSPDGRYIYYCAADSVALPTDIRRLQYALVRIPFSEETGSFGTHVDTLYRERSVCHPRISPDGRRLLFTVADYGTFPIWHPEADLRMLNLPTGRIDSLTHVNSAKSDTYHSWSSNSRWFVFASKRDDGLYGKPYFCYVDARGKAHKPFCLPQRHPAFYDNTLKSFNAPELGRGSLPFNTDDVAKLFPDEQ